MVWVYINDDGSGMKDYNGNPISHGGFTGSMSKYETTNAQYCQYLNAAKSDGLITVYNDNVYAVSDTSHSQIYFPLYPGASSSSQITYSGGVFSVRSRDGYSMADHPVVEVSWYGATAFCDYYGYRLPTEWEWQAVADYNGSYTYGCGTTINKSKANYSYYPHGYAANPLNLSSCPYTSPVDYYPSYGYGINDMAGNVWEWTSSCYYANCDYGSRVSRGGDWGSLGNTCTVSYRGYNGPGRYHGNGFRVCR
jgi:formylglycine-generating enzyme required for sulfatase activity